MVPHFLPLLNRAPHGSRSAMTCHYRCGNACDYPEPNPTDNEHISSLVERAISRRSLLAGGGAGASAMVLGGILNPSLAAAATGTRSGMPGKPTTIGMASFTSVPPNVHDKVSVPEGYTHDIVVRWGDPVTQDAPRFDPYRQTPESAASQFGYNCDYVGVIEITSEKAVLIANNEYTDEQLMFPRGVYDDATIKMIAMASHGMSVVQIERGRKPGSWRQSDHRGARLNRRVTPSTPFEVVGPVAGDLRLRTSADPSGRTVLGTFANCAGGTTPWGTVLSGEENFNGYFDKSGSLDPRYTASYARYGFSGVGRGWKDVDPRFDLTAEPHEPFRFGYIVEVDPLDPKSKPRKHTMLGRMKHEGANVTIAADGRAVVYMGDDERGDYVYKFVSRDRFDPNASQTARRHNLGLLTHGILYVARFSGDGSSDGEYDGQGEWIALTDDTDSHVTGMSVSDVLIDTRLAADKVSPTKMDRPEDIEPNPVNGKVYCALTNNSDRGSKFATDEANPLASSMVRAALDAPLTSASGNRNGYVLELTEDGNDHTSTAFSWCLMLVCGDPHAPETYFAGYPKQLVSPISCPDNVAFDAVGNLWISTDGNALGSNDGLFRVPVDGPDRGNVAQFLTVPVGAETCGPLVSNDQMSVFVAVQHPGETNGATFENPSSTWPNFGAYPRPSIVVAYSR